MKISVITPCHNAEQWIDEALQSVAGQSYQPHEVIVIDDNSSDESAARAAAAACRPRVMQVDLRNAAATRNVGVKAASGDWVAFLDADDRWYPHHLQTAVDHLRHAESIAFLSLNNWWYESSQERKPGTPFPLEDASRPLTDRDLYHCFVNPPAMFPTSGMVVNRARFLEVGGFDEQQQRRHDADMFLRVVLGHTWSYEMQPTWDYRVTHSSNNISSHYPECAYFLLRAMLKNEPAYSGPEMDRLILDQARTALSANLLSGADQYWRETLAWTRSRLGLTHRLFYSLALIHPEVVRWILRLRKRCRRRQAPAL